MFNGMYQICRSCSFSFTGSLTVGKAEKFRRLGQVQIKIKPLHVHQLFWTWCQLHSLLFQKFPVCFCKHSTGICFLGNDSFIYSYKEQCPDIFQPGSLHISYQYLVNTWRDQRHFCLSHSCFQDLTELFWRCCLFSQNLCCLIQQIHYNTINLCIFFFHGLVAILLKYCFLDFQFFLDLTFYDKCIKPLTVFQNSSFFTGKTVSQNFCFLYKFLPDLIKLLYGFRLHTSVNTNPFFFPSVYTPDSQCDHIIFQKVCFLSGNVGHTTAEIPEYAFIAESLDSHLHGSP